MPGKGGRGGGCLHAGGFRLPGAVLGPGGPRRGRFGPVTLLTAYQDHPAHRHTGREQPPLHGVRHVGADRIVVGVAICSGEFPAASGAVISM